MRNEDVRVKYNEKWVSNNIKEVIMKTDRVTAIMRITYMNGKRRIRTVIQSEHYYAERVLEIVANEKDKMVDWYFFDTNGLRSVDSVISDKEIRTKEEFQEFFENVADWLEEEEINLIEEEIKNIEKDELI